MWFWLPSALNDSAFAAVGWGPVVPYVDTAADVEPC